MKRLTNLLCVTSLAAVVAHAGVQESHSLLIKVQPGDMARYSVKMVFSDGAQKIEMTGMAQDRITKVEEDGTFTNEHVLQRGNKISTSHGTLAEALMTKNFASGAMLLQ